MKTNWKSALALLTTALIWGTAFIVQKTGMDSIGPFYFTAWRMFIGGLVLLPIYFVSERALKRSRADITPSPQDEERRTAAHRDMFQNSLRGGMICGCILYVASLSQQIALQTTTAGKVAFITALYIMIVPMLGLFLKRHTTARTWIGALIAVVGIYFLCIAGHLSLAFGDGITMLGSLFWALHILFLDHFSPRSNAALLVAVQSFTAAAVGFAVALLLEDITAAGLIAALPNLLYVGVLSTGVAFSLQAVGQKDCDPTIASILLSTETVFTALAGFIFLHEVLSGKELLGCALMFAAIILTQLPDRAAR